MSFHRLQVKNFVVGVVKLSKGDDTPANKVDNKLKKQKAARKDGVPAPPLTSKDATYLQAHAGLAADLLSMKLTPAEQAHGDARWHFICDASPRGLMPRAHEPWAHTGTVTFGTWWEIVQYDGLVYMLRGIRALRELTILRNIMSVLRISCRGLSTLGRPAFIPDDLRDRAIRACIAFEDLNPVVAHRHSAHMPIHLVRLMLCCCSLCWSVFTYSYPYLPVFTCIYRCIYLLFLDRLRPLCALV